MNRVKAQQLGLSQRDVAGNLLISLSSSGQTAPNFWINPANGVQYNVTVMTPQYKMGSVEALDNTPITTGGPQQPQLFGNLATHTREVVPAVINHYNVAPVFDVYASADRRDLGGVASAVDKIIAEATPTLPRGTSIVMRGQVQSMRSSFKGLGLGILFAILLVYIILVVNFQELARPADHHHGAARRAWPHRLDALPHTHTTFTVPSLMRGDHGDGCGHRQLGAADHLLPTISARRAAPPPRPPWMPVSLGSAPSA